MPAKKPTLPKPPMHWAKKRKVQSPLNQPVIAKNSKPQAKAPKPEPEKKESPSPVQAVSSIAELKTNVPLSSTSSSTPSTTRKPATVLGRRPDYRHVLVGLNIGDEIVFHKNPHIKARIEDTDWKVSMNGVEYEGIIAAAEDAYKESGLTPPKRVTGLSEWRNPDGVRLRVLYEKLPVTVSAPTSNNGVTA